MANYKCYFEHSVLNDSDFDGTKDTPVKILSVQEEKIKTKDGEKVSLCARLEGFELPLRLNATVCKSISKALKMKLKEHSKDVDKWAGNYIAIYVQYDLKAFGDFHDVLRVRPVAPKIIPLASSDKIEFIRQGFKDINQNEAEYCKKAGIQKLEELKADKAEAVISYINKSRGK